MAEEALEIFISYSRDNSDFVDRLQADLEARNFRAWVDRRKLEGGQDWLDIIQSEIERCDVMLVVLSPAAINSKFVKMEYRQAIFRDKTIIPLHFQHIDLGPIELNGIQWIDFQIQQRYEASLAELLKALALVVPKPEPTPRAEVPLPSLQAGENAEPDLVEVRPAPPLPTPDLYELFKAGLKARGEGNLDLAAIRWQQIIDRDSIFNGGQLALQMADLDRQLLPIRVDRLRSRAHKAESEDDWRQAAGSWQALLGFQPDDVEAQQHIRAALRQRALKARQVGSWGEEIGSWEALLKLDPQNLEAPDRIKVAEQNQRGNLLYESAQDFYATHEIAALREAFTELWRIAPFYGDPAGIAQAAGISLPTDSNYETVRADQLRKEAEAASLEGRWDDEILIWKTILALLPNDEQAVEYLPIAQQNKDNETLYVAAEKLQASSKRYDCESKLRELYKKAPYYGDPKGVAKKVNVAVPQRYGSAKKDRLEAEAKRLAREQAAADLKAKEDQENAERIAADSVFRQAHPKRYFRERVLKEPLWFFLICYWLFIVGVGGITTMFLGRNDVYFLVPIVVIIPALLGYITTFRKSLEFGWVLLTIVLGIAAAIGVSLLAQLDPFTGVANIVDFSHTKTSSLWLFGHRTLFLARQIIFGAGLGIVAGFASLGSYSLDERQSAIAAGVFLGILYAAIAWLTISYFALFGWGFGFGAGWEISLLYALPLGAFTSTGIFMLWGCNKR